MPDNKGQRVWLDNPLEELPTGDKTIGKVKITDGVDTALVDADGNLMVNIAAGGAGDGSILDGVTSTIKATVADLTNSNPLAVEIVDANGDQITSFGGGTQYTEDAVSAANPVGTVPILVRRDTPVAEVTTDGDNVAQRGSNFGAAYVTLLDNAGAFLAVGGGTQYTEDAAAAANPVGNALNLVREDARAGGLTTTDGDNVAARGTNAGELYVKHVDAIPVTDNASSLTIDNATLAVVGGGTEATALRVTVANDSTGLLSVDDNGSSLTVDNAALSVVGGGVEATAQRVTIASDSTGVLSVDDNGAALTVDNGGTFAVQVDGAALTALQLIDDVVFVEDVAAAPADKGIGILAVRRDADTSLVGADNDYANLQVDANGYLKVEIFDGGGSHTVDASALSIGDGTNPVVVVTDGADNLANTNNELVTAALNYGFDGTNWDRVPNGGGVEAAALRVTIANDSTGVLSVDDNGSSLTVDAAALSVGDGTNPVVVLTDGADNVSNANNELVTAALAYAFDGTAWDRVPNGGGVEAAALRVTIATDSTGLVSVDDNGNSLTVDAAGDVAHDTGDSGNPVKIGGKAATALPAVVAANDRANMLTDVYGRQLVRSGNQDLAGQMWSVHHIPAANAQATASKASAGAGVRNVCTWITIKFVAGATAPTAVNTSVSLIDGATGGVTYLWRATISLPAVAGADTGIALTNLWMPGTAATAMTLEFLAAGGANTIESVSFGGVVVAE